MGELEVIEALCCLAERAVAVIRDEQTKEALLRELDAATGGGRHDGSALTGRGKERDMKETMNPIAAVTAAALGVLSAYMVQLFIPLIVLVIAMVVDYSTGMAKAWSAGELCSRTGIKGIIKKVGYLVIVLVAMGADYLLRYGMEQVGIHINVDFLIAAIVIAWLIINELISILENVAAIGAPVPKFLVTLIKKLKNVTESHAETVAADTEGANDEN